MYSHRSAASVKRYSGRLQVRNIRTLTLIGNTASRPIRYALAKEELTHDIQNPVNHCISPDTHIASATRFLRTRLA